MRKTKIVATIGPVSEDIHTLTSIVEAGLDVARMNFSHGDHEEHLQRIVNLRQVCQQTGREVGLLLDTKGPEIRTGVLKHEPIQLVQDESFILTSEEMEGTQQMVSVNYSGLANDVQVGTKILIDDGLIELEVTDVQGSHVYTNVLNGGELKSRKGVNVPGVSIKLPGITAKDDADIRFGLKHDIDFIAASFVRKASDILEIKEILEQEEKTDVLIIAKIENQEGVDNLEEILDLADGIMVARGDLGVEIPAEEVPLLQKMMINKCNDRGKPVITATQMLDSMQRNPRPTRAEVTDVANAIFDGTDAIMLSGETAAGKYPVESVQMMDKIAQRTEDALQYRQLLDQRSTERQETITDAISQAVCNTAHDLKASAIITATESGYTARMVSRYRPRAPIIAVTPMEKIIRKLSLTWGVYPVSGKVAETTDEMLEVSVDAAMRSGKVKHGDLVVITAGVPVHESGTTNLIKVHVIGDIVCKGQGVGRKIVSGRAVVARAGADAVNNMQDGDILVTHGTDRDMMAAFEKASAVVTEEGGLTSHAAVVGISLGIPVIVGAERVTEIIEDGQEITVDAVRGHIYAGHARVL